MATKNTPVIGMTGKYNLRSPWRANELTTYECIAVRSFADCEARNELVYSQYYEPLGLVEGVDLGGTQFSFNDEIAANANIITLRGADNTIIYVPDTFIETFPQEGTVAYSVVVLSALIGMMPTSVSLDSIVSDVSQLISSRIGTTTTVTINSTTSAAQPTQAEHEAMEAARLGAITNYSNLQTQLTKALNDNELLQQKVNALVNYIREKGVLDDLLK